jgi:NADH:ubiquinone oxidoreductase subunit E
MNDLTPDHLNQVDSIIAAHRGRTGALIPVLHQCQEALGYLPREVQLRVAAGLALSPAEVFGVVTFYHFFTMQPRGRHSIRTCLGTACFVRGANEKVIDTLQKELHIQVGETTPDRQFDLNVVRCIGACSLAPAMMIGDHVYGRLTPERVREILDEWKDV